MTSLTMRIVRGSGGEVRHVPTPFRPQLVSGAKGKAKRVVPDPIKTNGDKAAEELRQLVERLERLHEERRGITDDIRDVEAEAKGRGYDTKGIRALLALRKTDKNAQQEFEAILETYRDALGML